MSRTENTSVNGRFVSSEAIEQDPPNLEPFTVDEPGLRQSGSDRKRAYILFGCVLSQLPIWGFAMSYGVFQEYFNSNLASHAISLSGSASTTGVIGTTTNGVMYLSMPVLFVLFTRRWAARRRHVAVFGCFLTCISLLLSSFSTAVWHLVATQGVLAALGCALMFSPITLSQGEWFSDHHRAVAYGVTLGAKNIVGSTCPFLFRGLLDHYGFRTALRIWTGIVAGTGILAIALIPTHPSRLSSPSSSSTSSEPANRSPRKIPWKFLSHRTIWIYALATTLQSSGYGIPQTYLPSYARDVAFLSQTPATLLLTLFNVPGIASCPFFGYLADHHHRRQNVNDRPNRRRCRCQLPLRAGTLTLIPAAASAISAFCLWGLAGAGYDHEHTALPLLMLFSITFGFFAGGYSATWGGVVNELEAEARRHNEPIDSGVAYGLLNGARGLGYVGGGLISVPLLKAGAATKGAQIAAKFAYDSSYGPLIIFTGLCSIGGGWGVLWSKSSSSAERSRRWRNWRFP